MRLVVTLFSVFAIVLATMVVHVGGAMAMKGMTDTSTMAEMNMGTADAPACPPEMGAKIKGCVTASAPVAAVSPAMNVVAFASGIGRTHFVLHGPDSNDSVSSHGLRRPPKFI